MATHAAHDLDLTPPTKAAKPAKTAKAPKAPKEVKPVELDAEGNPVKKIRGPKKDYGYHKDAVISISEAGAAKYRGQRKDWFDAISAFDGKTVQAFLDSKKDSKDPPRGWLRFFVQDGSVSLSKVEAAE